MNEDEIDSRLRALLAPPDEWPDEIFTRRVVGAIDAEARLAAARRRTWRRFAVDAAGSAAAVGAFLYLGGLEAPTGVIQFGPALAGFVLLGLWVLTALRPGPA
jgi:hypothetical protein